MEIVPEAARKVFIGKMLASAIVFIVITTSIIGYLFPVGPIQILVHEYLHAVPAIITGGTAEIGLHEGMFFFSRFTPRVFIVDLDEHEICINTRSCTPH